jgi:hypothetical protein
MRSRSVSGVESVTEDLFGEQSVIQRTAAIQCCEKPIAVAREQLGNPQEEERLAF